MHPRTASNHKNATVGAAATAAHFAIKDLLRVGPTCGFCLHGGAALGRDSDEDKRLPTTTASYYGCCCPNLDSLLAGANPTWFPAQHEFPFVSVAQLPPPTVRRCMKLHGTVSVVPIKQTY